ncbi:hypothetical protein ACFW2D_39480 [Streptomyces sp. NPDC058914]|uniref:SCO2400 family protein n=1 Tax=Streptomyces sp. NPDC058914 TaxID=3346671 RepID=UPI003681F29A
MCPGCGAYAPDIAPPVAATRAPRVSATAVVTTAAWEGPLPDGWHEDHRHDEHGHDGPVVPAGGDERELPDASGDVEAVPAAPQGRAARRRQLARWKKNKRKAAVATAVALVGGGLTVAAFDRQPADRTQAASAPDHRSMGVAEERAADGTDPASTTPRDTGAAARRAPSSQEKAAADTSGRQSVAAASPTTPRTATPAVHPDAATAPRPVTPVPQQQAAAPASGTTDPGGSDAPNTGGSGTAAEPPAASAPTGADGSASGTSPTSPAPAATSPSELCLLVLCLG